MANILKQIQVGSTTYNIEPYTACVPLYDLGNTTFKVTRGASQSTKNTGYWAGMLNTWNEGSPTLPSSGKWWHVISMDWTGTDTNNWISQLALPTQEGGVPHYRRNDNGGGISIDNSTWHAFITDENIGSQSVSYASNAGWAKANDVYDWAKASSKPSYTKSEVGLGNVDNTADANKNVNYATSAHFLRTYNSGDGSHGWDFLLKCKHNVDGDGRFKLQIIRTADGSVTHSTSVDYAISAGNADRLDGKHSSDFCLSNSNITNLPINGGIYWNSYVESSSDGSDAASITVIKDGNGTGGTVLQIKQANDSNDIVNVVAGDLKLNGVSVSTTSHVDTYFPRAKVGNDSHYSDVSTSFVGGVYNGPRTNDWEFLYRAEHRNGAGDGPNYVMEMVSNLTSDSSIYWRKKTGGSFTSFREIIDSNNIGSQNVNYANSAGSVAWGNVTGKPSTFPPIGHGHSTATQSGDGFMSSTDKKKLDGIAEGANKTVADTALSSNSYNVVQNKTIYTAFSKAVGFDSKYYSYGDNGSWRLQEYNATGNSLDIRYGKININAQDKAYSVSFGEDKSFNNSDYTIVFGIYRNDRHSWFWSPLVTVRGTKGFTVYVRGNTSGDNSGTLFYIAIRSN